MDKQGVFVMVSVNKGVPQILDKQFSWKCIFET